MIGYTALVRTFTLGLGLASLAACGSDTFGSPDGSTPDGSVPMIEGGIVDGRVDGPIDSGCQPGTCPFEMLAGLDMPVCVRANLGAVFWGSESPMNNVGRYDKVQGTTSTFTIPNDPVIGCALGNLGTSLIVATTTMVNRFDTVLNLQPVIAAGQTQVRRVIAADANYAAWSHFDVVHACGNNVMNCPQAVATPNSPIGIDVDLNNIFIAGQNPDDIYRCTRNGLNSCQTMGNGIQKPVALLLDGTDVYVSSWADNSIQTLPKIGGNPSMYAANQQQVRAIASDETNIYWITADGNVVRAAKVAKPTPVVLQKGQQDVWDLAVDAKHVYWVRHATKANGGGLYRTIK